MYNTNESLSNRLESLQSSIYSVYDRLINDDLIPLLSESPLSQLEIPERVYEIFSEVIITDREAYIEVLSDENRKILEKNKDLNEKFDNLIKEMMGKEIDLKENLQKQEDLSRKNRRLELDLKELEGVLKGKSTELEVLEGDILKTKGDLSQVKSFVKERDSIIEQLNLERNFIFDEKKTLFKEKQLLESSLNEYCKKNLELERELLEKEALEVKLKGSIEENINKCRFLSLKIDEKDKLLLNLDEISNEKFLLEGEIVKKALEIEELQSMLSNSILIHEKHLNKNQKLKEKLKDFDIIQQSNKAFFIESEAFSFRVKELEIELQRTKEEFKKEKDIFLEEKPILIKGYLDEKAFLKEAYINELSEVSESKASLIKDISLLKGNLQEKDLLISSFKAQLSNEALVIKGLKEENQLLSLENGLLIKSSKELELSLFNEKMDKEARNLEFLTNIKEKEMIIESLIASIALYHDNEEFLRRKLEIQEETFLKKTEDLTKEFSKTNRKFIKENIDQQEKSFLQREKEAFQKEKEVSKKEGDLSQREEALVITEKGLLQREEVLVQKERDFEVKQRGFSDKEEDLLIKEKDLFEKERKFNALQRENEEKAKKEEIIRENEKNESNIKEKAFIREQELFSIKIKGLEERIKGVCIKEEEIYRGKAIISGFFKEKCALILKEVNIIKEELFIMKKDLILLFKAVWEEFKSENDHFQRAFTENMKDFVKKSALSERKKRELDKKDEIRLFEIDFNDKRVIPLEKEVVLLKENKEILEKSLKNIENSLKKEQIALELRFNHLKEENDVLLSEKAFLQREISSLQCEKTTIERDNFGFIMKLKDFEEKNKGLNEELEVKTKEVSILSEFLVNLKKEIVIIIEIEHKKRRKTLKKSRKELEKLVEAFLLLKKDFIGRFKGFSSELQVIEKRFITNFEENHKEKGEITKENEKLIKEIKRINEEKDGEREYFLKENEVLSKEIEKLARKNEGKPLFFIKNKENQEINKDLQRKIDFFQNLLASKEKEITAFKKENMVLKEISEGFQLQLKLKTVNYEKLKEESLKENQKNNEDLGIWRKLLVKQEKREETGSVHRRKEAFLPEKLDNYVKELQNLDKSFNV